MIAAPDGKAMGIAQAPVNGAVAMSAATKAAATIVKDFMKLSMRLG
jgi:hypothetical protein